MRFHAACFVVPASFADTLKILGGRCRHGLLTLASQECDHMPTESGHETLKAEVFRRLGDFGFQRVRSQHETGRGIEPL